MPFTVEDFSDLTRLLEQRPEWRAELRRHVLSDELLALPELVRGLAQAQARTETRLEELAQAQARTEQALGTLAQRLDALTQQVGTLAQRLDALTQQVGTLAQRVDTLAAQMSSLASQASNLVGHVAWLRGEFLEARYHRHFTAYFGRLARRLRLLDASRVGDLLEDALDAHQLTDEQADALRVADLILTGRRLADGAEIYLVVEVSVSIDVDDVRRASERAHLLEQLGRPALPIVAGQWIDPEAERMALATGVSPVLDGRLRAPPEPIF